MSSVEPNANIVNLIISEVKAVTNADARGFDVNNCVTRTELDSHANMVVLGKYSYIFESTGRTCNVKPFSEDLGVASDVPIVDGALAYDCPYTRQTYIFIVRNALHIPSMTHNLVPPFIMRAGGVKVSDIAKIHCEDPTVDDHCIIFGEGNESDLRIPLKLHGTFSYFDTRVPTDEELYNCNKYFITPDASDWNPHCKSFEENERAMMTYDGEITDSDRRNSLPMSFLAYEGINTHDISQVNVDVWDNTANDCISSAHAIKAVDDSSGVIECEEFANALSLRGEISKVFGTLGSSDVGNDSMLFDMPTSIDNNDLESVLMKDMSASDVDAINASINAVHADKSSGMSPKLLSKLWCVPENLARGAVDQSTQLCRHNADNTLSRNLSTNDRMLRYRRLQSVFFTDTLFALKHKSTRGNVCCQVFVSDKGYVAVYPMKSQKEFPMALHWFCKQVGVPDSLVVDGHRSLQSGQVRRFCDQVGTTLRILEAHTPWANRAELYIGILKEAVRKDLRASNAPMVLWDYAMERRARIHNVLPRPLFQNKGLAPHVATFGVPGDISNICNFGWYEWIYFRDESSFPANKEKLGRILGPLPNEGNEMAQAILNSSGKVITRRSLRRLTVTERHSDSERSKRRTFDESIKEKLGDSVSSPSNPDNVPYSDEIESDLADIPNDEDPLDEDGTAAFEQPITDMLINAELNLTQGEEIRNARVIGRSKGSDGNVKGTYHENPMLNTLMYDVEFPDGEVKEYSANVIAMNMYSQVDAEGHRTQLVEGIVDFRKDSSAISMADKYVMTKSNQRRMRKSTVGWKLLVQFKNGTEEWIPLKLMKESNPVEVAEFAVARGIDEEPAFAYWVPYTLRKRDRIISAAVAGLKQITHKYGIQIPRSIQESFDIDARNGNTFWRDALEKEMKNLKVAFDILENNHELPPGYAKASGHLIWDVRMTLERKVRWVKDGHKTPEPSWSTYAGVVSRESVRIAFTYAALNGLNVYGADIQNAYLQAPSSEKHYIICGEEFGLENVGKRAIIVRALYGGKSAGADYWRHVRRAMESLDFLSCKADPDVWMRAAEKSDGTTYYEYVLLYTDDMLVVSEDPESFIRKEIGEIFTVKEKSIGPPSQYLGNKVLKVELDNGVKCWGFSSSQYVQNAVRNVEEYLERSGRPTLKRNCKSPWPCNYRPEIDTSPELPLDEVSYYQSLIGVLRWIVELGRADIAMETSALASVMAMPRRGHLEAVFHIFAFLKTRHNAVMVFDPSEPTIDETQFAKEDWSATPYGNCTEDVPSNAPVPRGIGLTMRAFVDSDHAGDLLTRRSRTGFIIMLNCAPIYWFSKKQTSCETSSFGSEFVAMKQCCEYIRGLRYKLRMMGIPVEVPSFIFGDNQSVLANTSKPHSSLKKKSSSIAFHFVREGVAKDEWRTTYLNTNLNPADMCTKSLPGGEKRRRFTSYLLHYVYGNDPVD